MASTQDMGVEDLDILELRVYDIHCYAKGRLVTKSAIPDVIKKGTGISGYFRFVGVRGQDSLINPPSFVLSTNYKLLPIMSTLKPCLKAVRGNRNIATVLCELRYLDGSLEKDMPREAARAAVQKLKEEFGVTLRSSFEVEFGITDAKTGKAFAHEANYASLATIQDAGDVLYDFVDSMREIGIKIDTLMAENGSGVFETTCDVTEGIEAADMIANMKTASYVYLKKKGLNVQFMTCATPHIGSSCGMHFNLSVWDSRGRNLFADPENPGELSSFGRHWLAGMVEHCPAMMALSSPTINCYRRVGFRSAPGYANWSQTDKKAAIRVKIEENGGNVYLENRIPSSACNPYLVLASTLVAGMEGVRRELNLPPPGDKSTRLPGSLEEALEELEKDTVMKSSLGEGVVQIFIYTKRAFEVEEFKAFGDLSDGEKLEKEKEYYSMPL